MRKAGGKRLYKCPVVPRNYCLNFFGLLLARDPSWVGERTVNHERIHDAQMRELLYLPFYVLYIIEWLVRLVLYRDCEKAYRNISFEREAYSFGNDLSYLKRRRPYTWIKFITN